MMYTYTLDGKWGGQKKGHSIQTFFLQSGTTRQFFLLLIFLDADLEYHVPILKRCWPVYASTV